MTPFSPIQEQIARAVGLLRAGQVIGLPTETVYGLAGDAANPAALARIFSVKNRPTFDPLIVHAASFDKARSVVRGFSAVARRLAEAFWPGPLTLVLPKASWVPDLATAGLETVAVRVPSHPVALELLHSFDGFLAAPSANKFGKLSPTTADAVREGLGEEVPLVIDGGSCEKGLESTIIGFDREKPVCLRLGALSLEQIAQTLGHEILVPGQFDPRLAPGNLPAHYAPHTRLEIFEPGKEGALPDHLPREQIAVVSFSSAIKPGFARGIRLSEKADLNEAATGFFAALRECDRSGAKLIIVEKFPEIGLGRALNDRLQKAAHSFVI